MAEKYRVNKEKCIGCGGESVCPYGAIEKTEEKNNFFRSLEVILDLTKAWQFF